MSRPMSGPMPARSGTNRRALKAEGLAVPDAERLDAAAGRELGTQDVAAAEHESIQTSARVRGGDTALHGVSGGVAAVAARLHAGHARAAPAGDHRADADATLATDSGRARASSQGSESIVQAGAAAAIRKRAQHQADHEKRTPKYAGHLSRPHDLGFTVKNQTRSRRSPTNATAGRARPPGTCRQRRCGSRRAGSARPASCRSTGRLPSRRAGRTARRRRAAACRRNLEPAP